MLAGWIVVAAFFSGAPRLALGGVFGHESARADLYRRARALGARPGRCPRRDGSLLATSAT